MSRKIKTCWLVIDEGAGFHSQALGLAEALGFPDAAIKRVRGLRLPWAWLPNHPALVSLGALEADSDSILPPWPDLVISCGRKAAGIALAIRHAAGSIRPVLVHVQRPQTGAWAFDLVVAPHHDGLQGRNVINMQGATHRVTKARLAAAAQDFAPLVQDLPKPRVAVLVGGSNRNFELSPAWAAEFGRALACLAQSNGFGLMLTTSRRTGKAQTTALVEALAGVAATIWTGGESGPGGPGGPGGKMAGANPYFGFLGLADAVIVTCDSVSMLSEALATGKPLYIAKLPGYSKRFSTFFDNLIESGSARWFEGALESWQAQAPDEMGRVSALVKQRLNLS
jgi:mitochondrial fission protein ELM1